LNRLLSLVPTAALRAAVAILLTGGVSVMVDAAYLSGNNITVTTGKNLTIEGSALAPSQDPSRTLPRAGEG
jgi:hypothetical protein